MCLSENDLPPEQVNSANVFFYTKKFSKISFILILLFLVSCSSKKPVKSQKQDYFISQSDNQVIPNYILLREAKYSDIPIPLGYKFILEDINNGNHSKENSEFLVYSGTLILDDLIEFYKRTLENEGWEIINLSNEKEGLLFCNKINKLCVISLRNAFYKNKNKSKIYLFIKNKEKKRNKLVQDINSKDLKEITL